MRNSSEKNSLASLYASGVQNLHKAVMAMFIYTSNLFATSEPPEHLDSNSPNLLLWFLCFIKSRADHSGITHPFINPDQIFFSNAPQNVCRRIIKKNQNKDFENLNSNILEVPMSWTSHSFLFWSFYFFYSTTLCWHGIALNACYDNPQEFCLDSILLRIISRDFFTPKFFLRLLIPCNLLTHVFDRMQIEMKSIFQIFLSPKNKTTVG